MCGRRVEGWRGLVPVGPVDLGAPTSGRHGGSSGSHAPQPGPEAAPADAAAATPQSIAGTEEPTRPIRISANLAAASASVDDEESRRPTGEVPSIGHEVRAKAPDQRVHTSPTGNILPSEVLQTLDAAIAANSAAAAAPPASARPAAEVSSSFRRPERSERLDKPERPDRLKERSGDLPLPRMHLIPPALADLTPRGGEQSASPAPRSDRDSTLARRDRDSASSRGARDSTLARRDRDSTPSRSARDATPTRSGRDSAPSRSDATPTRSDRDSAPSRSSPKSRRPERAPQPSPVPKSGRSRSAAAADRDDQEDAPDAAANAPVAVGFEPTHYIPRRRPGVQLMRVLRACMWALLWLGLGGVVAFGAFVMYRRSHPVKPPVVSGPTPIPPPRRTPAAPGKSAAGPGAPRPAAPGAPALVVATRARDLVVPIPAGQGRPAAPGAPPAAAPPVAPEGPAPSPAAAVPPEVQLDPQQQAAAEQTMSNIEFVVSERVAQIRACYDRAVRSAGPDAPAGRIEISLTLSDEGQPISISTVANTVGIPQLAGCLEQRIAEWRFPRPLGTARTFPVRLAFSPSPQQSGPRPRR